MNKHEAIKAAYGELFDKLTKELQEYSIKKNGWIPSKMCSISINNGDIEDCEMYFDDYVGFTKHIRPKSLSGIENNRGWTRIESEEDLPKEPGHYFALDIFRSEPCIIVFEEALKKNWLEVVSHYQPIDKPKPPIF